MRYAAGVLLIIAALFNGCAGSIYAAGGGLGAVTSAVGEEAHADLAKENKLSANAQADTHAFIGKVKTASGGVMAFGAFLIVMLGLQIAGAVLLFSQKARSFVLVIAGLTILAEVIGVLLIGFGWTNVAGFVSGTLAFAVSWPCTNIPPEA